MTINYNCDAAAFEKVSSGVSVTELPRNEWFWIINVGSTLKNINAVLSLSLLKNFLIIFMYKNSWFLSLCRWSWIIHTRKVTESNVMMSVAFPRWRHIFNPLPTQTIPSETSTWWLQDSFWWCSCLQMADEGIEQKGSRHNFFLNAVYIKTTNWHSVQSFPSEVGISAVLTFTSGQKNDYWVLVTKQTLWEFGIAGVPGWVVENLLNMCRAPGSNPHHWRNRKDFNIETAWKKWIEPTLTALSVSSSGQEILAPCLQHVWNLTTSQHCAAASRSEPCSCLSSPTIFHSPLPSVCSLHITTVIIRNTE